MPFLQTSRGPILAFLLVSFLLLLLLLSPFHENNLSPYSHQLPLHYLTLRSQRTLAPSFYSTRTRPPIYILKDHKNILCRLYHVCRLQNHHLLLPSHMKQYSRFLRTQCGLVNPFTFSSHRSLNKLNQTFNHDWIAPNIPYHHLHQYIRHHLPSFYSSPGAQVHALHNFEENNINATCLLPSTSLTHPLASHCPNHPELTIPYPVILLDQPNTEDPNHQQLRKHLTMIYQTVFKQQLQILDSETAYSSSDTICFRSMISSPYKVIETIANDSDIKFSAQTNVSHLSKQEKPSLFERLLHKIVDRLAQAFFDESPASSKNNVLGEQSNLGKSNDTVSSDFKDPNNNRSLRKLLGNKSAKGKLHKNSKGVKNNSTIGVHTQVNYTSKSKALSIKKGTGQKKNATNNERSSANSKAHSMSYNTKVRGKMNNGNIAERFLANSKANSTSNDSEERGKKNNGTVTEPPSKRTSSNTNLLNTNNTKTDIKNKATLKKAANISATEVGKGRLSQDLKRNPSQEDIRVPIGGSFDDVDLEENIADDFLPTFQYLQEYDPDT